MDGQRNAAKLEPRAVSEQAGLGDPSRAGRSRKWPVRALRHAWAAAAFLHLAACAPDGGVDPSATATDSAAVPPRHTRELIFAGQRGAEPLVSVLAFSTTDDAGNRSREVRGWLGHGAQWDTFLNEQWTTGAHGSPWAVVPHGPLRIAAGDAAEVEALWFRRGGKSLALQLGPNLGQWSRGPASHVQLARGTLRVGGETSAGAVLELVYLRRPGADPPGVSEQLLLVGGDSLVLLLGSAAPADRPGTEAPAFALLRTADSTREWSGVQLTHRGGRPVLEARREIPAGWDLMVPAAGIRGRIEAHEFTAETGQVERTGRRGVEAHYTVSGWVEIEGERVDVVGMARHVVR